MNTETVNADRHAQLPPPVCEEVDHTPAEEEYYFFREDEEDDFFSDDDFISKDIFQEKVMRELTWEARRWEDLPTGVIFRIMEVDEWWDDGIREYILTLKNKRGKTFKVWAPPELNNRGAEDDPPLKGMVIRSTGYKLSKKYYISYDLVRK